MNFDDFVTPNQTLYSISPYPFPSDSEWSSFSDWASSNSPYGSCANSPSILPTRDVRLARSIRGIVHHSQPSVPESGLPAPSSNRNAIRLPSTPVVPVPRTHIPRPVNAFMLFRSDFLKKGDIPSDIERRQQTLSKVAGEVWNAMRTEEKNKWHEKAAEHLLLHQKMYPDYKFTPARRGAARARASARPNDAETKARIRELRETYTSVHGPAVSPPRRRKARARRAKIESDSEKEMEDDQPRDPGWQHLATSYIPHSLASSEPSSRNQSPLPPCFPSRSEPHISSMRRPSTSLGFVPRPDYSNANESVRYGHGLTRPSSVESSPVKFSKLMADPDKTPTAATFQHIAMSPQAQKFSNDGTPHAFIDTSSIFDLDAALPEAVYFNSQNLFSSQSSSHDSSPQASGPCANASQAQFQAQGWDDPNILETFWSSPAYPVFPMEGLQSDFSEHWCKLVGWDNLALPHAQGNEMSTTY